MTLDEYLVFLKREKDMKLQEAYASKPKEEPMEVAITGVGPALSSGERLKKTIANLNKSIQKCGVLMWDEKNAKWIDPLTPEQLKSISIPVPEILTDVEKLTRAVAFAKEKQEEMGGLAFEPITRDGYYV